MRKYLKTKNDYYIKHQTEIKHRAWAEWGNNGVKSEGKRDGDGGSCCAISA